MSDEQRKHGATADDDSEVISSESDHGMNEKDEEKRVSSEKKVETVEAEFHSAEEDNKEKEEKKECSENLVKEISGSYEENESSTELIDEDGGGEGIADAEEVKGEFLDDDMFDASEDNEEECIDTKVVSVITNEKCLDEEENVDLCEKAINKGECEREISADEETIQVSEKAVCADKETVVCLDNEMSCPDKTVLINKKEETNDKEEYAQKRDDDRESEDKERNEDVEDYVDDEEEDGEYGEEEEEGGDEDEGAEGEEDGVKEEREQGDGEECSPNAGADKELDFDEDRRNPQYIPKKGIFYEHDDRNISESPKESEVDLTRDKKKKKLWLDDGKWGHDRYREDEQTPKSRNELIEAYGYDIRCEDGPPRARRRRRYGRGPTKYEPNWSEEEPGKERTLGMFIRRGTRGGRPRGRFRGNSVRGTGQQQYKSENEDAFNKNIAEEGDGIPSDRKNSFTGNAKPPTPKDSNFCSWKSDDLPLSGAAKLKGENVCGWNSNKAAPNSNAVKQTKDETLCGWESGDEAVPVPTHSAKQPKEENVCGWESDDNAPPISHPVKQTKNENLSGWTSNNNATPAVKQAKSENLNRWNSNETPTTRPVKQTKVENLCGWESDESTGGKQPVPEPLNSKEFPALPTKEDVIRPLPVDRNSAFTKRKPLIPESEPLQSNSVKTQTFENSTFSSKTPSSYEKPPRHEGKNSTYRGTTRGGNSSFRRMPRGRQPRGGDRYNNSGDSYLKPTLGPRLLDKHVNRINSDLDRMNLNNRNESYENVENLAVYEQKRNLNKQNLVSSSKNEDSASRPKRYSSMRQRTLPETSAYQPTPASVQPPQHPSPYYDTGYQAALYASDAVTSTPQPPSSRSPPVINPPQYQQYNPPHYQESYSLRMPVNNTPRLFPQVTVPAGQPIMTPRPCITPNPTLMNYPPPAPAPYPPQFAYQQQYTAPPPPPPPPVSQPPDLFCGGITYYYAQPQPPPVGQVPLKRPKAAIPIIPPPENKMKGGERNEMARLEELQCPDVDSAVDRTESSTLQAQAPLEVEG